MQYFSSTSLYIYLIIILLTGTSLQGVLNTDQLAEISKLLSQHKEDIKSPHSKHQDPQKISELVNVLRCLQQGYVFLYFIVYN